MFPDSVRYNSPLHTQTEACNARKGVGQDLGLRGSATFVYTRACIGEVHVCLRM